MTLSWVSDPGEAEAISRWMVETTPHLRGGPLPPGVLGAVVHAGRFQAAVAFYNWQPSYGTLQVSVVHSTPRWCRPPVLRAIFQYAFEQCGAHLLHGGTPAGNEDTIRFLRKVGFRIEPPARHRYGKGLHAVPFSMTRGEWLRSRWYKELPK